MGVYIKGMKMPENCKKCLGFERYYTRGLFDSIGWCHITGMELLNPNPPTDCPLVPVPAHGRCIDADALPWYLRDVREILEMPTIIPAEEGTDIQKEFMQNLHEDGE